MNPLFERIFDLFYEFRAYAILAVLVALSLLLMTQNDNPQVKRLRSISTVVFGVAQEQMNFIPSYFGLRAENELLRRINIELADETQRLREAKLENLRLRQLLALKTQSPFPLIAGRVVNKNLTQLRNTLTLNVGTADGVQLFMPVINDAGLIGLTTHVSNRFSVVNILFNIDFRASAKVQRSRVDGIIAWDGKNLLLKNIPKMRDVKVGDMIETSEYSSAFPQAIRIGLVSSVQEQASSLFKTITVVPGVDFVKLEEVFVINYSGEKERVELEQSSLQRHGK